MIVLYPVLIFVFFQWTLSDSWLVVFLSVIMFLCTAVAILYPTTRTLLLARRLSPEELYTTPSYSRTFGALYIPFRQERYQYFITLLAAVVLKSLFISFAKASGLGQVIALFIIEIAVLVILCVQKPYRSRGGDILAVYLAVTRVIAAGLMIPFVQSLQIKAIPRVAVGFVLLALYSIASVVMIVIVVLNFGNGLLWRRHSSSPLTSSGGSDIVIEKGSRMPSFDFLTVPIAAALRPKNPTPSTSFSNDQSIHSRHFPRMSAALSPNYTIPTFLTSDNEDGVSNSGEESPYSSTCRHSQNSSIFAASSPHVDQFPLPPDYEPGLTRQSHDTSEEEKTF